MKKNCKKLNKNGKLSVSNNFNIWGYTAEISELPKILNKSSSDKK